MRDFIYPVTDERFFTLKENYAYTTSKTRSPETWSLETDERGFRVGPSYTPDQKNIVFLGDSVPFGWDLANDETVPAKFSALLQSGQPEPPYGVINAAIPSYALYQAIQRYQHEIHGQLPVKYVILQTYDPVSQFERFGRGWNRNLNWYTQKSATEPAFVFLKYSALYWLFSAGRRVLTGQEMALDVHDELAIEQFKAENIAALAELYASLQEDKASLILLPATVPQAEKLQKRETRQVAIATFNQLLQTYAASQPDVYFFDVESYLYQFDEAEVFLDKCCHLTKIGSALQAEFILEQLMTTDATLKTSQMLPLSQPHQVAEYLRSAAEPSETIISLSSTTYFQSYLEQFRPDLIYLDDETAALPPTLAGRWFIFWGVDHIPESWSPALELKRFDYLLLVHRPDNCPIELCLAETSQLFSDLSQANPGSVLAQKINNTLPGLADLPVE